MPRRRFFRACAAGSLLAAVVFVWMITIGRRDLFQTHALAGFYDAQAHALLGGHWDIPLEKLGFEAFLRDGKAYTYFGPWPTVLRLPVAALTDAYDSRLTQVSILGAFTVLMIATARLLWRIRELARGEAAVSRTELWCAGVFMLAVGAGSVVLFLASRPVVYHEAELWGAAWAVAAYTAIIGFVVKPGARVLTGAGIAAGLCLMTRSSVGLGPMFALALVLGLRLLRRDRSYLAGQLACLGLPALLYAGVNIARFGHPWKLPIDQQVATLIDPIRPKIFEGTNGSLFALKFVPTDVIALFRPDGLRFTGVFPWITFPSRATPTGGITFASLNPAASLPSSMPLFFVLAVVGLVIVCLRGSAFAPTRAALAGGIVGGAGVVTIPFVDHRYLSDFMPFLVVAGAVGMYWVLTRIDVPTASRALRRTVLIAAGVIVAFSLWTNFALALSYQREYSPFTSDAERAAFVRFQRDAPGGGNVTVDRGAALPDDAGGAGTLFVFGDCDGVYWSDGADWHPVERTDATGFYPLELMLPESPAADRETLLVAGPDGAQDRVDVEYLDDDTVRFYFTTPRPDGEAVGSDVQLPRGEPVRIDVVYDPNMRQAEVFVGGRSVVGAVTTLAGGPVYVARATDEHPGIDFSGTARLEPASRDFCRSL